MVDESQRQRQTPQTSNAMDNYYGFGRGLDVRNPGDLAIQRAQSYPSNRQPLLNQPPMQRPQPQQRPHGMIPFQPYFGAPPPSPKQHPNPRMRHINPRGMNQTYVGKSTYPHELQHQGMGGGLGGLRRPESFTNMDMFNRPDLSFRYSHMDPEKVASRDDTILGDESIRGTWRRMQDARRADEMDEYGYLEGAPRQRTTFTEGYMDPVDFNEMYGGVYDDEILRSGGLGGLQEQAAVDPSDWRTILRILDAGGDPGTETQTAEMGGYGYNPAPKSYNDIYKGTDIIDMEVLPGAGYGPDDEYDFDYKRDRFEDLLPGTWPQYAARGGLMSLRR